MSDLIPSAAPTPVAPRVRRGRRGPHWTMLLLPAVAVGGVLSVVWVNGLGDPCGGPVPGCGNLLNTGDVPITVHATTPTQDGDQVTTGVIAPDERGMLSGVVNEVRVDAGQCLIAEGGPFWDARTVIDRTTENTGVWHPVDDWGARAALHDGSCPDGSEP